MHFTQVRYFVTVAEHLSFTKAADKLFVSQSTLSRQIALLEKEIDTTLFVRSGRDIRLTSAGTILYKGLKRITQEVEELMKEANHAQAGYTGCLHIGVLNGLTVGDFMPHVYQNLLKEYPNIELVFHSMTFDDLLEALYSGKLDMAFSIEFYLHGREQIIYDTIAPCEDYIVMNKAHPRASTPELTLKDCEHDTFVLISPDDNARSSELIIEACRKEGFEPRVRYAPTLLDQMLWIEAGMGVSILDTRNILLDNPNIAKVPLASNWSPNTVLAWYKLNYNPAIPLFLKKVKQFARNPSNFCICLASN